MGASKPFQYICFYPIEISTEQGDAYIFAFVDIFSKFLFQTGVESTLNARLILKHMSLIPQNKDFKKHYSGDFRLILHKYEELQKPIEELLAPFGVKVIIDEALVAQEMIPVMEAMFKGMAAGPKG